MSAMTKALRFTLDRFADPTAADTVGHLLLVVEEQAAEIARLDGAIGDLIAKGELRRGVANQAYQRMRADVDRLLLAVPSAAEPPASDRATMLRHGVDPERAVPERRSR